MDNPTPSQPDADRSRLRALMRTMDEAIAKLPAEPPGADGQPAPGLRASFNTLTAILALGPEPKLRACPNCQKLGMYDATLCGYCWAKLTPPASV